MLDNSGNPAVSYCRSDGKLGIARRSSLGSWSLGEVDTSCTATSVAKITATGLINIAYSTGAQLRYAKPGIVNGQSVWLKQTLATAASNCTFPCTITDVNLIIDWQDTIHIGYNQGINGPTTIRYIRSNAGGWDAPIIIDSKIENEYVGMALNANNLATFTYITYDPNGLWLNIARPIIDSNPVTYTSLQLAFFQGQQSIDFLSMGIYSDYYPKIAFERETWGATLGEHYYVDLYTVADDGNDTVSSHSTEIPKSSAYVNLQIDSSGIYTDQVIMAGACLFLGTENGWSWQQFDCDKYYINQTSLAVDSQNLAHVSFYDWGPGNLMFATQTTAGAWQIETLDTGGKGKYASLAIAPDGSDNIAYYDSNKGDLKLIYNGPGGWLPPITVDGELPSGTPPDVGGYPSLKMDSSSLWHISYYDFTNKDLKYASYSGGSWYVYTVDSSGDVGQYSSLVLDSGGYAHIAYYDATNGKLKYAYQDGQGWHKDIILDQGGDGPSGSGVSLAALPNGYAVAYIVKGTGGDTFLRYSSCSKIMGNCLWLTTETVAHNLNQGYDDVPASVGLAVSPSGKIAVSFSTTKFWIGSRENGTWRLEEPDPTAFGGYHSSLAFDWADKLHASYLAENLFDLRVATQKTNIFLPSLHK